MTDFDDAIGDMTQDLLTEAGTSCVYNQDTTSTAITMRKSTLQPMLVDNGDGVIVEMRPVDFICLSSAFPHDQPLRGDSITIGAETFEVQASNGEKCWRQISPQMLRIHTKQV